MSHELWFISPLENNTIQAKAAASFLYKLVENKGGV